MSCQINLEEVIRFFDHCAPNWDKTNVRNEPVIRTILDNGGMPNPFLGGQDHYAIFASAAALANGSLMSEYDDTLNSLWSDYVTTPYTKGEKDLDTCLTEFKAAVAAAITTITVE